MGRWTNQLRFTSCCSPQDGSHVCDVGGREIQLSFHHEEVDEIYQSCVCVCVCVFESLPQQLPVEKGGRELVHCTLSQ